MIENLYEAIEFNYEKNELHELELIRPEPAGPRCPSYLLNHLETEVLEIQEFPFDCEGYFIVSEFRANNCKICKNHPLKRWGGHLAHTASSLDTVRRYRIKMIKLMFIYIIYKIKFKNSNLNATLMRIKFQRKINIQIRFIHIPRFGNEYENASNFASCTWTRSLWLRWMQTNMDTICHKVIFLALDTWACSFLIYTDESKRINYCGHADVMQVSTDYVRYYLCMTMMPPSYQLG